MEWTNVIKGAKSNRNVENRVECSSNTTLTSHSHISQHESAFIPESPLILCHIPPPMTDHMETCVQQSDIHSFKRIIDPHLIVLKVHPLM